MPPTNPESAKVLDIESYLKRIRFVAKNDLVPSLSALDALIKAHVRSVPFENVDVLQDKEISLNIGNLQRKIIDEERGGYCFELNTLFGALLTDIGFKMKRCGARVIFERDATVVRPRTHKGLIVSIDGKDWLCDVTFGAMGLNIPIQLDTEKVFTSGNYKLRVVPTERDELLQTYRQGEWVNLYLFNRNEMEMIDYEVANFYTSKYPDSIFRSSLTSLIDGGSEQYIIRNRAFSKTNGLESSTLEIQSKEELQSIYRKYFGMNLSLDELQWFDRLPNE